MRVIIGALVWLIIFILCAIPLGILALVKLIINIIYCHSSSSRNDEEIRTISGVDGMVATDSSWKRSLVNVGFVLKVEGKVDLDRFREHFATCFNISNNSNLTRGDSYDKLYSYLVTRAGYVFRACSKNSLNLSEQIVERNLLTRENGDNSSGTDNNTSIESLEEFLSRWLLQSYSENRPCWEIAVIPMPEQTSNSHITAVAFKIHHGICDGYSLVHIIDKLTGAKAPYLVKDFQDGFGAQLKQMLESPLNLGRMGGMPIEKNPFRVNLPPLSPDRKPEWMFSFTCFPLDDMKTLRRKNGGVHMTCVIWTIVTGALRQFLLEEQVEEIPEYISVGNTLPWPRHPAMNEQTQNQDKICNHWVAGILNIPLREPDPLIRIQQIEKEYVTYLSLGLDKFCQRILFPVMSLLPGSTKESALLTKDPGFCGGLTSLIGADSYSLLGFPVQNVHPFLAIPDNSPYLPISSFTFSHSGRMELTLSANPLSVFKNKQTLDRICHKLCHTELENFLIATNNFVQQ